MIQYDRLRRENGFGFAHVYLWRCDKDSEIENKADIEVYNQLIKLDTRLGTTCSEQLFHCLLYTTRLDIIKVDIIPIEQRLIIIQDY